MNPHTSHPLKRLTAYSHRYRRRVILATICFILNKLFDLPPPVLIGVAVDVVALQEESFMAQFGVAIRSICPSGVFR